MTVGELIQTLIGFPQSAPVVVQDTHDARVLVDLTAAREVALLMSKTDADWYYHQSTHSGELRPTIRAVELVVGDDSG